MAGSTASGVVEEAIVDRATVSPHKLPWWGIVELTDRRRLAGFLQDAEVAGSRVLRVDIYHSHEEHFLTQFYAVRAIYCITPCTKATALKLATVMDLHRSIVPWEIPMPVEMSPQETGISFVEREISIPPEEDDIFGLDDLPDTE